MRDLLDLTARYLADPAAAGLNPRQCAKLERGLARAGETLGRPRADTVEHVLATAVLRLRHARPTLYVNNVGSSGSHWLNAMLRDAVGLLGAGEIYVPAGFLATAVAAHPPERRPAFLQAVYLAHLLTGRADDVTRHVCNTAHLRDLAPYTGNDIASLRILLIRDPVEIALSRTLRKPAYRAARGRAEAEDAAYLEDNVRIVDRFFAAARPEDYDLVCRYEDLVADPAPVLAAILRLLGTEADPRVLRRAARSRRPRRGKPEAPEAAPPDALRAAALRGLAAARARLGYA